MSAEGPILVLNGGSSSLKFALFDSSLGLRFKGQITAIGGEPAFTAEGPGGDRTNARPDREALDFILAWLSEKGVAHGSLAACGHRIVHGGSKYLSPTIVTDDVAHDLDKLTALAPLQMPACLSGLHRMRAIAPGVAQIACFDTAFHATQPEEAVRLPLPRSYFERGYRRYGFHGLNYEHVTAELPKLVGQLPRRLIVAHLGQGASMCAIKDGKSIATTMGYSTADGLVMGTRPGSLDPGALLAIMRDDQLTADQLDDLIYRQSGLLGLSGISGDMRTLLQSSAGEALAAVAQYCYAAACHAGSLAAALEGADAIVFTGGVGENAPAIRQAIVARLEWLGCIIDPARNRDNAAELSPPEIACPAYIIAANEELVIARHARQLVS